MSRASIIILFRRARARTFARRVNTCTHARAPHGRTQAYVPFNVFTVFSLGIGSQKASVTGKRPELLTKKNHTHTRSHAHANAHMKYRNMRMHKRARHCQEFAHDPAAGRTISDNVIAVSA